MGLKSFSDDDLGGVDAVPERAPATPAFPPTDEQQSVVDAVLRGDAVTVNAFAGCGKTTTQKLVAEAVLSSVKNGKRRAIHYLAFNKAMEVEAKGKFPMGVKVSTIHAMALQAELAGRGKPIRNFYMDRLKSPKEVRDAISREFGRDVDKIRKFFPKESTAITAILNNLRNYCYSDDAEPGASHVDIEQFRYLRSMVNVETAREFGRVTEGVARRVWERMSDPDSAFPITHDTYLKVWERSGVKNFDLMLLDEAQDTNPVMLSGVRQAIKAGTQVVLVGDAHQAIYEWRGAINAMEAFPEFTQLSLTESWRFGQNIADHAQLFLGAKGETRRLMGKSAHPGDVRDGFDGQGIPCGFQPDAILCRSNAGVINGAFGAYQRGQVPYIEGGAKPVADLLSALDTLQNGGRPWHPELQLFNNWQEIVDFADTPDGGTYKPYVNFVTKQKGRMPEIIRFLQEGTASKSADADLVLSTMHKSKGLEWDRVHISDDVSNMSPVNAHRWFGNPEQRSDIQVAYTVSSSEANLLYVAWTRARKAIDTMGFHGVFQDEIEKMRNHPLLPEHREIIKKQAMDGVVVEKEDILREERKAGWEGIVAEVKSRHVVPE